MPCRDESRLALSVMTSNAVMPSARLFEPRAVHEASTASAITAATATAPSPDRPGRPGSASRRGVEHAGVPLVCAEGIIIDLAAWAWLKSRIEEWRSLDQLERLAEHRLQLVRPRNVGPHFVERRGRS
jgi:hypothetical protein